MSLHVDVLISKSGVCRKCSRPMNRGEIVFIVERPVAGTHVRRGAIICGDCGGVEIQKLKAIGRTPYNSEEQFAMTREYRNGHEAIIDS